MTDEQLDAVLAHIREGAAPQAQQRRRELFASEHVGILESIAAGEPLHGVLERIVRLIERLSDGIGSILLLDAALGAVRHGAAPSLPSEYVRAIDGQPIGPAAGSCGTAAYTREPVFVRDIATHPYWEPYRDVALNAGLRACWSTPILAPDREVLGTFAIYYREPRDATDEERSLVATATHIAAIAITRDRHERALLLSEGRYRQLLETSHEGVLMLDRAGTVSFANTRFGQMFGCQPDALIGKAFRDLTDPSEHDRIARALEHRKSGSSEQYELHMRRRDGQDLWAIVAASPVMSESGEVIGMLKMLTDITERRRTEAALSRSELELRSIFESTAMAVALIDVETRPLRFNTALSRILGYDATELPQIPLIGLVHPDDRAQAIERKRSLDTRERRSAQVDLRMLRKSGEAIWVRVNSSHLASPGPARPNAVVVLEDISESKRLEESVRAEERLVSLIYQSVADVICYLQVEPDECYRLVSANPAFCQLYGVELPQIVGRRLEEVVDSSSLESSFAHYREAIEERRPEHWEELAHFPSGTEYAEAVATPVFDDAGRCTNIIVVSRIITERKRAEAKLTEQAALLDRTRDAIVSCSLDREVRFWNRGASQIYGFTQEEALGRRIDELIYRDLDELTSAETQVLAEGVFIGELTQYTRDGRQLVVDSSWTLLRDAEGHPESVLSIHSDATEQKKLEEHVMLAQRMESLGTLAGGIAHDFNNILAAMRGYLELATLSLPATSPAREHLTVVRTASDRAVDLVQQILTFSRRRPAERTACRLQPLVDEVLRLMRATLPRMISIEAHCAPEDLEVMADPTQIHQVIMNLGTNAAQALGGHGTISVRLAPVVLREHLVGVASEVPPGSYMCLTVADDGCGMDQATLRRIFEPFYTTKAPGSGTGLGLSVVLGIIREHGGALKVSSAPGRGTKFEIYLPEASASRRTSRPPRPVDLRTGRRERILCVDDENALVALEKVFLESLNYRVEAHTDPLDALQVLAARPNDFAAIVTDFAMSEMSGIELAEAAREICPRVPIIMVSGYLRPEQHEEAQRAGVCAILTKPDYLDPLAGELGRIFQAARLSVREAG